uniref:Arylsulfatase G-like n=1 Tax=Saccoglossus kowalevskii TaxID=10224 RepID=A0ABM0MNE0_SACKO|nr:PREDICTED: arylsulfatase G-like [Saccoglossus kowalevskii]
MVPRSTPVYTVLLAVVVSSHETKFTPANLRVKNPNFIVLFADDIGWGDLGANWNQHKSNTPNLDTLAKNGIRFTDFHSGASVCTPSRAALLTGRLGLRTGVTHNFQIESVGGLPLNETTFAETFKAAGYRTGMLGKWHLGVNGRYHPSHRGFDYYFGLPYSNDMGCCDNPGYDIPSCAPCPKDRHQMYNQSKYNDLLCYPQSALPLYENTTIIEQPVDIFTLSERYADKALEFIENSSQHDQPFLLYVAFAHMHVPLAHRTKFTNSSTDGIYGDTLRELDDVIGRIVQSVRKANKEQDTLIWFTGDNGSWSVKCQYGGSQGPFLGTWQKEEGEVTMVTVKLTYGGYY